MYGFCIDLLSFCEGSFRVARSSAMADDEMEVNMVEAPGNQFYNKQSYTPEALYAKLLTVSAAARGKPGVWKHFKPMLASDGRGPSQCHLQCLHCGRLCTATNPSRVHDSHIGTDEKPGGCSQLKSKAVPPTTSSQTQLTFGSTSGSQKRQRTGTMDSFIPSNAQVRWCTCMHCAAHPHACMHAL